MAVAIRFEDLTKKFGTFAIERFSLEVEPGELFFLLGPSGCGKTTLLRCLAGFCEPDSGRILIADRDVTRLPPYERDTGMVFQSYALWPHLTVRQNVAFGLEMRRESRSEIARRVTEVLETVHMSDRADYKPNQLSGGQQQRVALARALVVQPQCLLLDEPLSNLDAKLRLEMRTEIRRICKAAGLTGVYVTHDQKEALTIADRLAVLDDGAIRQVGTPRDVYLRPNSRFVAGFIGETNFVEGEVTAAGKDGITVRTAVGVLTSEAEPPEPLHAGDRVVVSVRPEVVRVGEAPGDSPNAFDGRIHDTVYLGEVAQHQVSLDGAEGAQVTLKAYEMNPKIVARDTVESARVWIDASDVVVLKS